MKKGYVIGAGPGDIGLITKKAYDLIEEADVILYDRLINKRLLDRAKKDCELIYVGKSSTSGGESQLEINRLFVDKVKEKDLVIRLHGGDPFLFGRGTEEIDLLLEEGYGFEVVPGISSSFGVPSYGGIPLTKREISSSLHIYTARSAGGKVLLDFETMAKLEGTINILMGVGVLDQIVEGLVKAGMDTNTPVSIIQEGTTPRQKSVGGTLSDIVEKARIKEIKPPSIITIGGTAGLLGTYDWFTKGRLFGKRIIITRDKYAFPKSAKVFEKEGAEVVSLPMIELETNFDSFNEKFVKDIKTFDFISFNSPMAVRAFFEGIDKLSYDLRILAGVKIIGMGSGTVEELLKYKLKADYIPSKYSVETLLEEINEKFGSGTKVLLLSSDIHNRVKEDLSEKYKLEVDIKSIYTNKQKTYADNIDRYLEEEAYMVFLSSSAVESFYKNTKGKDISKIKFVSIGPMTSKALYKYGYEVGVEAKIYSLEGILDEVLKEVEDDK